MGVHEPTRHALRTRPALATSTRVFPILFVSFVAVGCMPLHVRRENARITALCEVEGTVTGAERGDAPLIVTLVHDDRAEPEIETSAVLYRGTRFHFYAERGMYSLFAFVDENRNLRHDEGESAGWYGRQVMLQEGKLRAPVELELKTGPLERASPYHPRYDEIVTLNDEVVSEGLAKKGMWSPADFRAITEDRLFLMEPFDAKKTPVIFVHGIGGHPDDMRAMIEKLDRTRFQPWLFWFASGKRFAVSAQSLTTVLDEFRVLHDFDDVVVVAQSVGGLVAREAVATMQQRPHQYTVNALITMSTPWGGHAMAQSGLDLSLMVLPAWHDMAIGSQFQQNLLATSIPQVRHYLFFSYGSGSNLGDDGSVALSSELELSMQRRAVEVIGFPETHMGIITNADSLNRFSEVLSAIRDHVATGPQGR